LGAGCDNSFPGVLMRVVRPVEGFGRRAINLRHIPLSGGDRPLAEGTSACRMVNAAGPVLLRRIFVRASALVPRECLKLRVNARRDYLAV